MQRWGAHHAPLTASSAICDSCREEPEGSWAGRRPPELSLPAGSHSQCGPGAGAPPPAAEGKRGAVA